MVELKKVTLTSVKSDAEFKYEVEWASSGNNHSASVLVDVKENAIYCYEYQQDVPYDVAQSLWQHLGEQGVVTTKEVNIYGDKESMDDLAHLYDEEVSDYNESQVDLDYHPGDLACS